MKQASPATERNREPIREVLGKHLPGEGLVLEIASGAGEHAIHMARHFPAVEWQPSDPDPTALASIAAWASESGLTNLRPPLELDVTHQPWPVANADAVVCINMVHIAPWEATEALFAGAGKLLPPRGLLYLYGPYRFNGVTAPSNDEFDRSLKARDPRWGVRDIRQLTVAATTAGLALEHVIGMPANNHSLIFRRRQILPPTGRFVVG